MSSAFALIAITLPTVSGAAVTTRLTARNAQSEVAALKRVDWTSNVKVSRGNGSWTFISGGLPGPS